MSDRLSEAERIAWLRLARTGGVGPRTFRKLLDRFGTARRALGELPALIHTLHLGDDRFRLCPAEEAEAELEALRARGCHLLLASEPAYPAGLREIADPPPVITIRGDPAVLETALVAVVGARNASGNGRSFARTLARDLAAGGLVVVSGLARGIDSAAHEGALEAGGLTVAVVAAGVDVAYPPENAALMERVAAAGAIVSERPLGAEPQARHFPKRNRLIAGLSVGIVVVEAAPQSGSLITARLAAEQGREVMAVPGSPLDPRHRGTNRLLRDGATLIESAEDVLAALGPQLQPHRRPARRPAPIPRVAAAHTTHAEALPAATGPLDLARLVAEQLSPEPLLVDDLIRQCGAPTADVHRTLLDLELEGRLERHPGGRVSLAAT